MTIKPLRRDVLERPTKFRFRPSQGRPRCFVEQLAQHIWTHKLAWWTAAGSTITAVVVVLQLFAGLHR